MAKMHDDEVETSVEQVQQLIEAQFPSWADLPIRPVPSAGTDNALYRLGEEMVVRLPRIQWAIGQAEKEIRWLPTLAPHLPLAIPTPLKIGKPDAGYPWTWSVYRWLPGKNATLDRLVDEQQAASQLADFILALQRIDAANGPPPDNRNSSRGVPLIQRNDATLAAIALLHGKIDTGMASAIWKQALYAPKWTRPPVWIHGDLQAGNLLALDGRLSSVIDFGCMGVGDPACDVMAAWSYLGEKSRVQFRDVLNVDDATWMRARGWALSVGVIALPYYEHTNPVLASIARRSIQQTIADFSGRDLACS